MTVYEMTVAKIERLPEALVEEVYDFVEFLLTRSDPARWQQWQRYSEAVTLAETGLSDYLPQLQEYEEQLARGEVKW
jgi:hypothetical protein